MADIWVPLRAGIDILFLGALINYVLENEVFFREYVVHYTNATRDHRAMTSRTPRTWVESSRVGMRRRNSTIRTAGRMKAWNAGEREATAPGGSHGGHAQHGGNVSPDLAVYADVTLAASALRLSSYCGNISRATRRRWSSNIAGFRKTCFCMQRKTFCEASGPDKTGAICYAVGWTQHSSGVQIIRCAAILQLLLGNIGRPGGGIMALRGHASIQGSTDIPTLYDILPGYLPHAEIWRGIENARQVHREYGHARVGGTTRQIHCQPAEGVLRRSRDARKRLRLPLAAARHRRSLASGLLAGHGGRKDGRLVRHGPESRGRRSEFRNGAPRHSAKLKWLVVREMVETETASFWYESPEVTRGELKTEEIPTEVFLLPAAGHAEKEGTFTNTQRLLQWREKAVDPPGDCRSENWFMYHLGVILKEKAKRDPRPRNAGLLALTWDYSTEGKHREVVAEEILQEINGRTIATAELVPGFTSLKADGSTACGCWIYSGVFPKPGENRSNERASRDFHGHGWGFAWPSDRSILYNRASARPDGKPWSERKKLVWWDAENKKWTGNDVPDFVATKPPDYQPPKGAVGDAALAGDKPFILHADGFGWIWVPVGLNDGPLPAHYEPLESPVRNPIYPERQSNPVSQRKTRAGNEYAMSPDRKFPFVLTTYRLTEHHTAGGMSRTLSHLAELQPEMFCEISVELAEHLSITPGEWVTIVTARGAIEAHALVTPRMQMLTIEGEPVYQVGLPFHWGYSGLVKGDIGNDLDRDFGGAECADHGNQGAAVQCDSWETRDEPASNR